MLFGQEHVKRYLETDGAEGHEWRGTTVLILTTTGRRSGEPRSTPLIYQPHGDDYVVVASKGGAPEHPAWYLNIEADPEVTVQVLGDRFKATARTATPDEKPELWRIMTERLARLRRVSAQHLARDPGGRARARAVSGASGRQGDWSHRRLHFVGIGGAGMSGLALVAHELGAQVTGSDRAESSYTERLREHGIEPAIGHAAANVPAGAEVVYSTAVAAGQSRAAGRAGPGAAPGRPAGPDRGAAALRGRDRHPRQDHDGGDDRARAARSGARSRLRDRRRAARHRLQRGLGTRRVDRGGGRRVRSLAAQDRSRRGGADQRRARPPLDLRVQARPRADL